MGRSDEMSTPEVDPRTGPRPSVLGKRPRTSTISVGDSKNSEEGVATTTSSSSPVRKRPATEANSTAGVDILSLEERIARRREEILEEKKTKLAKLLNDHDAAVRNAAFETFGITLQVG